MTDDLEHFYHGSHRSVAKNELDEEKLTQREEDDFKLINNLIHLLF